MRLNSPIHLLEQNKDKFLSFEINGKYYVANILSLNPSIFTPKKSNKVKFQYEEQDENPNKKQKIIV